LVAIRIIRLRAIAVYFALLLGVQAFGVWSETSSLASVAIALLKTTPFVLFAFACFGYLAWAMANNAVYTVTSKRIVMRIGIALTLTYNIPYSRIAAANLLKRPDGSGDIALELQSADKIAWINLWPHVRAWKLAHPQPLLRCIADVGPVAEILSQAWQAARADGSLSMTPVRVSGDSLDAGLQAPASPLVQPIMQPSAQPAYRFSSLNQGNTV
jgi:hypothetical protein